MKLINKISIILFAALILASCQKKVNKDVVWPVWASKPFVENAMLRGMNGETKVNAGDMVRFTARVYDKYNDLASYTLEFKAGNTVISSVPGIVKGASDTIELETIMPFGAYYEEGSFYPEVSLIVNNVVNGSTTKRLDNDHNVSVIRPATPAKLYIIDNKGTSYDLERIDDTYDFKSNADLSMIGSSFHIAQKVAGGQPDYSGLVWGYKDGTCIAARSQIDPIPTPSSQGYGIRNFTFSVYSFELSKVVNHTVTIDKHKMEDQLKGGAHYLVKENVQLVRDCIVEFENFTNVEPLLQEDRFADITATSARFTGPTRAWRFFMNEDNSWMIVNTNNNEDDLVWITGKYGGYPKEPYTSCTFDWFGTEPHGYLSMVKVADDASKYRILVHLEDNFELKVYGKVSWGTELIWKTVTPETITITSENYGLKGSTFTEGVYMITYDKSTEEVKMEKYNK